MTYARIVITNSKCALIPEDYLKGVCTTTSPKALFELAEYACCGNLYDFCILHAR